MNLYVKSVKPQDDYCLLLEFENGEKRVFDLKPYLEKPIFKRLKSTALFQTARVVSGSVEWQGEVDLSYDTLYLESKVIRETQSPRKKIPGKKEKLGNGNYSQKEIFQITYGGEIIKQKGPSKICFEGPFCFSLLLVLLCSSFPQFSRNHLLVDR